MSVGRRWEDGCGSGSASAGGEASGAGAGVDLWWPVKERLVKELKGVVAEVGPEVTWREFRARTGTRPVVVVRSFGSWGELRVAAGLERVSRRPQQRRYRSEDILARLRELVAERGPRITRAEFTRETGISDTTLTRHFGGWMMLRRRAGLVPRMEVAKRLSDDELLETFDGVARKLGRVPTEMEFNRIAKRVRMQTLYKRFGRKEEVVRRWEGWRRGRGGGRRV